MDLIIDKTLDEKIGDQALKLLRDYYMQKDESSPQEAYSRACLAYCAGDLDLAQRLYDYVSRGWMMFASPVLSNAPFPGERWEALPISCFLSYVPDTVEGLIGHTSETRWLSVKGGGVGGHWSDVRGVSDVSPGPIPFLKTMDADITAYRQGKTRKGSYAAYMDISHPEIEEFLIMRTPTGGDPNRKCLNLHNAINITDCFMERVVNGSAWELKDPHTKQVMKTLPARELWQRILETRFRTGEPYLNFIDEANRCLPDSQKKMGLRIHGSNLCFSGDTKVAVADGRDYIDIQTLADNEEEFLVWSARKRVTKDSYGKTVKRKDWIPEIRRAIAKKTGVQEVINVILDDGTHIVCTEEHKLGVYNGDYVEARNSVGYKLQRFGSQKMDLDPVHLKEYVEVVSIEREGLVIDVYDLLVEGNHNFFIITSGLEGHGTGVLVHNCNEIHLATDRSRTAVCCLSSINLEAFDEWRGTTIVQDMIRMLDNVLQIFIDNCPSSISRARYSAERERSLGLGTMGFHSYLQKRCVPFESAIASSMNRKIFKLIRDRAVDESRRLALERGEPEDIRGTGLRNAHLLAVAPNANSAVIVGCSPSIEPWKSNAYTHRTRAGTHLVKNRYLEILLESLDRNTEEVWQSIILSEGSVQHLDFLTQDQKDVFKTAFEIDQRWIVDHASSRQPYICQGQSVNLFFPSGSPRSYVNEVHIQAWRGKLKGLYYLRSTAEKTVEKVSHQVGRIKSSSEGCLSCHA